MTPSLVRLGDLAEFVNGLAFKPEDWEDDGARIIRIQNLTDPTKLYNRTTRTVAERYLRACRRVARFLVCFFRRL
jgi:type I restriction enzyme S subunit